MENHIETNFREIQKILDSCIAHDYKIKIDALFLKREYLTQAQLKDYLRQEIFRVTENIVAIQQNTVSCVTLYWIWIFPIFVGKRFFEDLDFDERKSISGSAALILIWMHICMNRPAMMGGFLICPLSLTLSYFPSICAIFKTGKQLLYRCGCHPRASSAKRERGKCRY